MLGCLEDLLVWRIGTRVATHAGSRLAGLSLGESVSAVTGRARSFGTIWVDSADSGIRPGLGIEGPVPLNLDLRTVALIATSGPHLGSGYSIRKSGHSILNDRIGLGVDRTLLLLDLG
jgi:hypothetical protein